MFLTKEQRKRKADLKADQTKKRKEIDAALKLKSDRAQRDSWAHLDDDCGVHIISTTAASSHSQPSGSRGGGAKRPRSMASIFEKPVRTSAAEQGESGRKGGLWRVMPAPFPRSSHHEALLERQGGDGAGLGDRGVSGCAVCAAEFASDGDSLPNGGLPPLTALTNQRDVALVGGKEEEGARERGGRRMDESESGGVVREPTRAGGSGKCMATASREEAAAWRNAVKASAANRLKSPTRFVGAKPFPSAGREDVAVAEGQACRANDLLSSPAAWLFADRDSGTGAQWSGRNSADRAQDSSSGSVSGSQVDDIALAVEERVDGKIGADGTSIEVDGPAQRGRANGDLGVDNGTLRDHGRGKQPGSGVVGDAGRVCMRDDEALVSGGDEEINVARRREKTRKTAAARRKSAAAEALWTEVSDTEQPEADQLEMFGQKIEERHVYIEGGCMGFFEGKDGSCLIVGRGERRTCAVALILQYE